MLSGWECDRLLSLSATYVISPIKILILLTAFLSLASKTWILSSTMLIFDWNTLMCPCGPISFVLCRNLHEWVGKNILCHHFCTLVLAFWTHSFVFTTTITLNMGILKWATLFVSTVTLFKIHIFGCSHYGKSVCCLQSLETKVTSRRFLFRVQSLPNLSDFLSYWVII